MKTHRISTTISQKHWAILNKYAEKYNTQQKVLEMALENLEKKSEHNPTLSPDEVLWMRIGSEIKSAFLLIQKDAGILFMENTDIERFREYVKDQKPSEFAFEWYYRKPLKECSLPELIDGIVLTLKIQGGSDSVEYTDESDHYKINMMHGMGLNLSKLTVIMYESLFKSYGAQAECHFSERSVIFKVYKNLKT